jgi:hypothetical protein
MKIENIKFKAKRLDNGKWVEGYMEAGQLLVLLLSFCALALHIKNRRRKD